MQYGRAATLSVDSDRLPTCQVNARKKIGQEAEVKSGESERDNKAASEQEEKTPEGNKEELRIWSLNVRSIANEIKLKELEQEAKKCAKGILLVQETWRRDPAERIRRLDILRYRQLRKTERKWHRGAHTQKYTRRVMALHLVQTDRDPN